MNMLRTSFLTLAVICNVPGPARGQCPSDYLLASDAQEHSFFGDRVAVSGDFAIVGARYDNEAGVDAGAAYLFELVAGRYVEVLKVIPPSSDYGQHFGHAVAIDGDRALVGSSDNRQAFSAGAGFMYLRTDSGWVLEDELFAATPLHAENLGIAVALQGERAVLGAPGTNLQIGHAIVFERTAAGWVEIDQLHPQGPEVVRGFGTSVEMSGNRILVGANSSDGAGAAYVFDPDPAVPGKWSQVERLVGHDAAAQHGYGQGIALDGDRVVYTTPYLADDYSENGAAYVFEFTNGRWAETQKLTGSGDPLVSFGTAADIRGDRIVIGCLDASPLYVGQEYVEVFRLLDGEWVTETRVQPVDGVFTNGFGREVALRGDTLLIGSPLDADPDFFAGGVHLFNLERHTETTCSATPNSTGAPAVLTLECSAGANEVAFRVSPLPNAPGILFYGPKRASIPSWDGTRCVRGAIRRLPITHASGNALEYTFDMQDPPPAAAAMQPGTGWYVQAWFRDAAAGASGANFSSGLHVVLAP